METTPVIIDDKPYGYVPTEWLEARDADRDKLMTLKLETTTAERDQLLAVIDDMKRVWIDTQRDQVVRLTAALAKMSEPGCHGSCDWPMNACACRCHEAVGVGDPLDPDCGISECAPEVGP